MIVRGSGPRQGFTLLEIILALTIFVAAAAVLSRLILIGIDHVDYAQRQAEGVILIENRFAELDAGIITTSAVSQQTDSAFPDWQWSLESESAGNYLYRVTVTAERLRDGKPAGLPVKLSRQFFDSTAAEEAAAAASSSSSSSSSSSTGSTSSGSSASTGASTAGGS